MYKVRHRPSFLYCVKKHKANIQVYCEIMIEAGYIFAMTSICNKACIDGDGGKNN